jgi:hypothetical protein
MYGMVLMAAMTGTPDAASFGNKSGCTGVVYSDPCGCTGSHHKLFGGGLFHKHSHGCTGCTGYIPAPACCPAPVVVAPAPACCPAPAPTCGEKKHCGLFGGKLFGKHKHECCETVVATPCCGAAAPAVVVPPAVTPPAAMPDKKPVDKKPGTSD